MNLLPGITDDAHVGILQRSSACSVRSPSSEVVSSEEFHTSHRHHPELLSRRLSDAQPPFGPLQKRSTAPTHLWDHPQGRDTPANQLRSGSAGSGCEPS